MNFWNNLTPSSKKLLLVGIPVVAVIAFVVLVKGKGKASSSSSTPATGSTTPAPYPGTAVDTGQLGAFESQLTNEVAALQGNLDGSGSTPMAIAPTEALGAQAAVGSGYSISSSYGAGIIEAPSGGYYSPYATYDATLTALEAGQAVFYEPALGQFVPITSASQLQQLESQSQAETGAGFTTWSKIG